QMSESAATLIEPENGKTVVSPAFKAPPLRINPGLPPTPGKSRMAAVFFARISVLASKVRESPGNVCTPAFAGLRMRVLFWLAPNCVPLKMHRYVFPALGEVLCQIAPSQFWPEAWVVVVVNSAAGAVTAKSASRNRGSARILFITRVIVSL